MALQRSRHPKTAESSGAAVPDAVASAALQRSRHPKTAERR